MASLDPRVMMMTPTKERFSQLFGPQGLIGPQGLMAPQGTQGSGFMVLGMSLATRGPCFFRFNIVVHLGPSNPYRLS